MTPSVSPSIKVLALLLIEAKKVSQSILLVAFTAGPSWSQLKTSVIKIGSIEPASDATGSSKAITFALLVI